MRRRPGIALTVRRLTAVLHTALAFLGNAQLMAPLTYAWAAERTGRTGTVRPAVGGSPVRRRGPRHRTRCPGLHRTVR